MLKVIIGLNKMKTYKVILRSIKDSDIWADLAHELKYDEFKKNNSELDDEELSDKFYIDVVSKKFEYGEYADIEIEVDENFNIVSGKIL